IRLQSLEVRSSGDMDVAFQAIVKEHPGALIATPDNFLFSQRGRVLDFVAKNRLPGIFSSREWVKIGGLMSYGTNIPDLYRRAAAYVAQILQGAKPGDLPIEQPTKFELIINAKTAKALGLIIPQSVLTRADEIIQ